MEISLSMLSCYAITQTYREVDRDSDDDHNGCPVSLALLLPDSKWALFNFAVFHSKFVALLFSGIYVLSEVLVVNHGSFQMQRIFSIFLKTTIIKSAHFETGCPL